MTYKIILDNVVYNGTLILFEYKLYVINRLNIHLVNTCTKLLHIKNYLYFCLNLLI